MKKYIKIKRLLVLILGLAGFCILAAIAVGAESAYAEDHMISAVSAIVQAVEDTPLSITLEAHDSQGLPLTYYVTSVPSGYFIDGTVEPLIGAGPWRVLVNPVRFQPYLDACGIAMDSFQFKAAAATVESNIATVTLNIQCMDEPPERPTDLVVSSTDPYKATIVWVDRSDDEAGFIVERSTDRLNYTEIARIARAGARTYNDAGPLAPGVTYYYRAAAYNANGKSLYSNSASFTAGVVPAQPCFVQATALSPISVEVSWLDNSNNEMGFYIYRSPDGSNWSKFASVAADKKAINNTIGLSAGTVYYYRVTAYNDVGESVPSEMDMVVTPGAAPDGITTWYVSKELSGTREGASPENAWYDANGINWEVVKPGDTVIFKGGEHYRRSITLRKSGFAGQPITFKGDGWPGMEAKAVIDGSIPLTGWQRASADDCGGNPNWGNIWYTQAPAGASAMALNLYQEDELCWLAQQPDQLEPFYWDRTDGFYYILNRQANRNSIVDPFVFTQEDPDYWKGAQAVIWVIPNMVNVRSINAYIPSRKEIIFDTLTNEPYRNRLERYALLNHVSLLDQPGEYCVKMMPDGSRRLFFWPLKYKDAEEYKDPNVHEVTASLRFFGININSQSHFVIEGFKVQKQTGSSEQSTARGIGALTSTGANVNNVVIRNNHLCKIRFAGPRGYGALFFSGDDNLVEGNLIEDNPSNISLLTGGSRLIVRNNRFQHSGNMPIWLMGGKNSQITGNTIIDSHGTHSNAIAVYAGSSGVLVAGNKIFDAERPLMLHESSNVDVVNNLFDGKNVSGYLIRAYASMRGTVRILNNTVVNSSTRSAMLVEENEDPTTRIIIKNNIFDGGGGSLAVERANNILTSGSPRTAAGESLVQDLGLLFARSELNDFRLMAGSPAVDAGADLSEYLGVLAANFPDYDFTKDIEGKPRTGVWDIGAYEYDPSENLSPRVDTGPDMEIGLLQSRSLSLHGTLSDDGKPQGGSLSCLWSKVSGPGQVVFSAADAPETTVTFSAPGEYILRLTVSDGALESFDELMVKAENSYIIDNTAFGPELIKSGTWSDSVFQSGYFRTNYIHDGNTEKGEAKYVMFTPDLPEAGEYNVYIWYPASTSYSNAVPVDIVHAGGTATVSVNQTAGGGAWKSLGVYRFNSGSAGWVKICTAGTSRNVIADAVKFVPAGGLAGDANLDREVNIADAIAVAKHCVGISLPKFDAKNADVDCNPGVTINDAITIAKYVVRAIQEWPDCGG